MKVLVQKAEEEFMRRVVMDEEDAVRNEFNEAAINRIDNFWMRGIRLLLKKGIRSFNFDCFLVAIGQGKTIELYSAVEIARRWKKTKQNATEAIKDFQAAMDLPPMPGQRPLASLEKMIAKRNGDLNPNPTILSQDGKKKMDLITGKISKV
jgi:hypothetical protein